MQGLDIVRLPEVLETMNTARAQLRLLVGDKLGMIELRLEERASFRKEKRSHKCIRIRNVTCRRVPLHWEPLLPQI